MALPAPAAGSAGEDKGSPLTDYGWVRNRMARQLLQRTHRSPPSDGRSVPQRFSYNYNLRFEMLGSAELAALFILNSYDTATYAFLQSCEANTSSVCRLWVNAALQSCLRPFASVTTVNGLLSRGAMWVLSAQQFATHLEAAQVRHPHTLLDIGAGDGNVTKELAQHFSGPVHVTEADWVMQWRLRRRGYRCLPVDGWEREGPFDVISCLNVLDRCDRPLTLLRQMRGSLTPGSGVIILAVVLPFRPFVEVGAQRSRPTEELAVSGDTIEEQIAYFAHAVFGPVGLAVRAFSRAPYLCQGDMFEPYYLLHDAVFVLSPCEPSEGGGSGGR